MPNVIFSRLYKNDTMIFGIEVPQIGQEVFLDGINYEVTAIKHFPEGGKNTKIHKEIDKPFVLIDLCTTP